MHLSAAAFEQFTRIQSALNNFIYAQLQQAAGRPAVTPFRELPLSKQLEVRDAFLTNPEYVDRFVAENPRNLSSEDLQIALTWRQPLAATFILVKHLKNYSVFLSSTEQPRAYGVVGLTQPIREVLMFHPPPVYLTAALLPFGDQIVYDGLLAPANVNFGPGLRKSFTADYNAAKERFGIITKLTSTDDEPLVHIAEQAKPEKPATPKKRAVKKVAAKKA